jgi:multiple antibiotic resistance protein
MHAVVPTGFAALDAQLPGGGWPCGVLTELLLAQPGVGEMRLLAPVMAGRRLGGPGVSASGTPEAELCASVMWFGPPAVPCTQALQQMGVDVALNQADVTCFLRHVAGEAVLASVGVSIPAFRIAGGIVLLMMALSMLQAQQSRTKQTREEEQEAEAKASVAFVPIAIPLLTGPGAISTAIIYSNEVRGVWPVARILVGMGILALACWLVLRAAGTVTRILGRTGINIMTRLMGLLLAATSVEFIADGIIQMFPRLAAHG